MNVAFWPFAPCRACTRTWSPLGQGISIVAFRRRFSLVPQLLMPRHLPRTPLTKMDTQNNDPLAQFGLDAIDLRWTLKDIASNRTWILNKDHLPKLMELGLVEMRDGVPCLTITGEKAAWQRQS